MPGPKPPQIVLSEEQRLALEQIVRAHSSGQALVRRALVVLLAAMGYSNMDMARQVPIDSGRPVSQWIIANWRMKSCAMGSLTIFLLGMPHAC